MSLVNVAYSPAFTWADPRVRSLEAQMRLPMFNCRPIELGLSGHERDVEAALAADAEYAAAFHTAFPDSDPAVSLDNVIKAIATFERTLIFGRAPFDRYVFDDDTSALTLAAKRGMTLFYSERLGCARCHFGLTFSGPIVYADRPRAQPLLASNGSFPARKDDDEADWGLFAVTHRTEDRGRFRVPSLRNIALTAPYMHDGRYQTLGDVLDHYARMGRDVKRIKRLARFQLSDSERSDLIAFLQSLTDPAFGDGYQTH
jgi:cytochrome c peroxidase